MGETRKALNWWGMGLLLLAIHGCAGAPPPRYPTFSEGFGGLEGLKAGQILDTRAGRIVSYDELLDELAKVRIVYVGETHTSREDHQVQKQILEGLSARQPHLALALEMFPRETQSILDRYAHKLIPETEFLKEVEWDKNWGYPFLLYRPMLELARERGLAIVGLNAPREVVSKVAEKGLASLTPKDRGRLAREFHQDQPQHRAYVREQYDEHMKGEIRDFEAFFEAQLAWEETMAETLAQRLTAPEGPRQILVLIGKGHISHGVGLPMLTAKRVEHPYKTVAPMPIDYPDTLFDPQLADYVWITEKAEPQHRGRLGVMLRQVKSGKGLEVLAVLPGSPAEKAGLRQGDLLRAVDGIPLKTLEDLHRAFAGKPPLHRFLIRRDGRELTLEIHLPQ